MQALRKAHRGPSEIALSSVGCERRRRPLAQARMPTGRESDAASRRPRAIGTSRLPVLARTRAIHWLTFTLGIACFSSATPAPVT